MRFPLEGPKCGAHVTCGGQTSASILSAPDNRVRLSDEGVMPT